MSSKFDVFVAADRQLCSGYGRASSSLLPGGRDEGVDCVGSCSTGRSYCYAANAGLCASCVLWDPVGDEVLCYSFGTPQGGPLPGTSEWGDDCAATSSADAEEANALSTNLTSSFLRMPSICCARAVADACSTATWPGPDIANGQSTRMVAPWLAHHLHELVQPNGHQPAHDRHGSDILPCSAPRLVSASIWSGSACKGDVCAADGTPVFSLNHSDDEGPGVDE